MWALVRARSYLYCGWVGLLILLSLSTGCKRESQVHYGTEPPENDIGLDSLLAGELLPQITMKMGGETVTLEVVEKQEDRRLGLMYRDSLAPNAGMLFVFSTNVYGPFWMKNTYIPLSIAFISSDSTIVGIEEMEPLDTVTRYMPDVPYQYAIEMNAGWFTSHGVKVGDKLKIPQLP